MSMLFASEQIAGAAQLQIPHRDFKAAAKLRKFPDCRQTLLCDLFEHLISSVHQKGICRPVRPSDTTAQLIELG